MKNLYICGVGYCLRSQVERRQSVARECFTTPATVRKTIWQAETPDLKDNCTMGAMVLVINL